MTELDRAKRSVAEQIAADHRERDYVVLHRHYDDGEDEWDDYLLCTRTSAQLLVAGIPLFEPDCRRALIKPYRL